MRKGDAMRRNPLPFVFAVLVLLIPLTMLNAQEGDIASACQQAQIDVRTDVNGTLWLGAGCLFGIFGVGAAYLIEPSPPAMRLMGKSPQYVAAYTDCYKSEGKTIQGKKAITGCLIGVAVEVVFYVLFFVALASSD